jgi:hypothetical protein
LFLRDIIREESLKVILDSTSIKAIEDIVNRGNNAEVQRRKDGVVVLEVKKQIKASPA